MNKTLELLTSKGIKTISRDNLFIIAEVGNQFAGSLDKAKALCKAAKESGADAVKFILWFPEEIMADKTLTYSYETTEGTKTEPMYDMLDRLRLPLHEWLEVKQVCDQLGIIFMVTVNSPTGFEWAYESLGVPCFKLSSWDYNFTDLWTWCAKTGMPTIADLGPVTEEELDRNIDIFAREKNRNLMFLQCFHTKSLTQMNMLTIPYMREKYDCLVGYSSPDNHDDLDLLSIGLGACVLEKRMTLDRKAGVLHDAVSKQPKEFANYMNRMRALHSSLGHEGRPVSEEDLRQRKLWFRRIVADENIPIGTTITREMLEAKRGETGISPEHIWDFAGKVAKREIRRNDDIYYEDI